jgi:hypothetical protein
VKTSEAALSPVIGVPSQGQIWRGSAFGIHIDSPVPLLAFRTDAQAASGAHASFRPTSSDELRRWWPSGEADRLVSRTSPDGRTRLSIDRHDKAGYRIWASRHGTHVVSHDGTLVRSAIPDPSRWRWQRLLFAQALPLAARLQGVPLLHASAVSFGDAAIALVATSGTGKSSLAVHLVDQGATLVTDDVLAVTTSDGVVWAHPGAPLAGVERHEFRELTVEGRRSLGPRLGSADKLYVLANLVESPRRLAAIYFLERGPGASGPSISDGDVANPRRLLASAYMWYLRTPAHLAGHLRACADLARYARTFSVSVSRFPTARETAREIAEHFQERLANDR